MPFIHDDFLLSTSQARSLYHGYAAAQPIIDYHCHLEPKDIAANRRFANLTEIWLEGDHYKWRAMRAAGVKEKYCTGDASPKEKFLAWAKVVPLTLRNPLYHWTHLELKRYFGIDDLLSEKTAESIWEKTASDLAEDSLSVSGILRQFDVRVIGTTDSPIDSLAHHQAIKGGGGPAFVIPSFRPDPVFKIQDAANWNAWVDKLQAVSGADCSDLDGLKAALLQRADAFAALGCRASDHGLDYVPHGALTDAQASSLFGMVSAGNDASPADADAFAHHLLLFLGEAYADRGWAMQLHLGALRNANDRVFRDLGPDKGCDTIGDPQPIKSLAKFLGALANRGKLPKTILYNLNPADNYAVAAMCGNFFQAGAPGKIQFGSGWWFLDQLDGMTMQLNALSSLGLLSQFIGMLTDSRSFMSFPRHEYFRRLLCDLLGKDMAAGLIPDDTAMVGQMVSNICYANAARYFGFETL